MFATYSQIRIKFRIFAGYFLDMTIAQLHNIFISCGGHITTDSRTISKGDIFLALKGENFDGNAFALKALESGAAYAVVNEDSEAAKSGDERIISVPDTLAALRKLATYHRENTLHNDRRIKMLALTGTNGKTTTKELIKAVLSTKYNITATGGNFNNNIGVPLTLLQMTPDTELAIIEMGASHPGDIKELVDIAHPDFGLITNVGRAHLLGFGSFEGVKNTKGELYDYIQGVRGKCFVNTSSADLVEMAEKREGLLTIPYGARMQNAKIFPLDAENPFLRMSIEQGGHSYLVQTHLVGSYNADNVLAAIAVGCEFGVDVQDAVNAISAYVPNNNRSQLYGTEFNSLIVDAYNANPSSMAAAIDNFCLIRAEHKALFLGDMLELGEESLEEHRKVLAKVAEMKAELVILVGKEFEKAAEGRFLCFDTSDKAAEYLAAHPIKGFTALVKGSRGTRMEKLIPSL